MTLPDERIRAVNATREFLLELLNPKKTPRIPKSTRQRARNLLKHYPWPMYVKEVLKEGEP